MTDRPTDAEIEAARWVVIDDKHQDEFRHLSLDARAIVMAWYDDRNTWADDVLSDARARAVLEAAEDD